MRNLLTVVVLLGFAAGASAQTDPCTAVPAGTTFTVTSGSPFTVAWVMDATVLADDGVTQVPQRISGFYLRIDAGAKLDIPTLAGSPCPAGTTHAGKIPYTHRTSTGVARGAHTAYLSAWNFQQDCSSGVCVDTSVRQESAVASVPFAAVDPRHTGPPKVPVNILITR